MGKNIILIFISVTVVMVFGLVNFPTYAEESKNVFSCRIEPNLSPWNTLPTQASQLGQSTKLTDSCLIPKHDQGKGKLDSVSLVLNSDVTANIKAENQTDQIILAKADWVTRSEIKQFSTETNVRNPFGVSPILESFDGSFDFEGDGSSWTSASSQHSEINNVLITDPNDLQKFTSNVAGVSEELELLIDTQTDILSTTKGVIFDSKFIASLDVTVEYTYSTQDLSVNISSQKPYIAGSEHSFLINITNNSDSPARGGINVTVSASQDVQITSVESEDFKVLSQDPVLQLKSNATLESNNSTPIKVKAILPKEWGKQFYITASVRANTSDGQLDNNYTTQSYQTNNKPLSANISSSVSSNLGSPIKLPLDFFKGIDPDGRIVAFRVLSWSENNLDSSNKFEPVSNISNLTPSTPSTNLIKPNIYRGDPKSGGIFINPGDQISTLEKELYIDLNGSTPASIVFDYVAIDDVFEQSDPTQVILNISHIVVGGDESNKISGNSTGYVLARTGSVTTNTFNEISNIVTLDTNLQYLPSIAISIAIFAVLVAEGCVWLNKYE